MTELYIKMGIAGILFGAWPLIMNRSGLESGVTTVILSTTTLVLVAPFALRSDFSSAAQHPWLIALAAGIVGGLGLLAFNSALAKASTERVGSLFVLMTIVQISVAALYHAWVNGGVSIKQGVGFAAAACAAFLLL